MGAAQTHRDNYRRALSFADAKSARLVHKQRGPNAAGAKERLVLRKRFLLPTLFLLVCNRKRAPHAVKAPVGNSVFLRYQPPRR